MAFLNPRLDGIRFNPEWSETLSRVLEEKVVLEELCFV